MVLSINTIRWVFDHLYAKSWKAKSKASTPKTLIDGSNGVANVNADGFDCVELASGNAKAADVEADWVESGVGAGVIVDAVSLKLDVFAIKASAWLTTTSGQVGYKPKKKKPPRPVNEALV